MRHYLLGSTALVAAALAAGQAQAADPIKLTLGGFYGAAAGVEIGGADGDNRPGNDRQTGAFKQNVEVHFNGSTTLDNGLTVGAHIELEANNTPGRTIDEVYTYFKGGFGEFRFGDTNGAVGKSCVVDPGEITNNFGLISPNNSFTNVARAGTGSAIGLGGIGTCEDSIGTKAVYFSPVFGGFQLALSYAPNSNKTAGPTTGTGSNFGPNRNIAAGYLSYNHSFGGFNLTAGGGAEYYFEPADGGGGNQPAFYQAGLQVGFGRFAVGASGEYYQNYKRTLADPSAGVAGNADGWLATVGASYAIDAWTIGLEGAHGNFQTDKISNVDTYNSVSLQGTYKLGPGIRLEAEAAYFWYHDDQHTNGLNATDNSASIGLGSYITF